MRLHVIATGSTGNAYVLDAGTDQLLLDAGVRWPRIQEALGFDLSRLRAALVTHEHQDHAKAAGELAKAGIPVVMTEGTRAALGLTSHRIQTYAHGDSFRLGSFTCLQFDTQHDAAAPCGWMVRHRGETLLYATDTFYLRVVPRGVNYFLVECNYVADTLDASIASGRIPAAMKPRLLKSHFELGNVVRFLRAADLSRARKIVLVHLSDSNSDERHMVETIQDATGIDTVAARAGMNIELELTPF